MRRVPAEVANKVKFPGWHLIGLYPDNDPGDVGAWLLHHNGEAMLLEVPEGLLLRDVEEALTATGTRLKYITASHHHEDHMDMQVWEELSYMYANLVQLIPPFTVSRPRSLYLGGELVYLIPCAKHSTSDIITVFRGVAMTGDIELGTLESVTDEVSMRVREHNFKRAAKFFADKGGYQVNTIVSAHVNDIRTDVDWPALFSYQA
jgi:hypothetical protein